MNNEWDALARESDGQAALTQAPRPWGGLPRSPMPPALDLSLLPPVLRDMAVAVADSMAMSREMAALVGLGVGSACNTGRVFINLYPGWDEPGWCFFLCIAKSTEGKSQIMNKMSSCLLQWQEVENKKREINIKNSKAWLDSLDAQLQVAKRKGDKEKIRLINQEILEFQPVYPISRFVLGDITPEAMLTVMRENDGAIAQLDDEARLFNILSGQYQQTPDLDPWLNGYSYSPNGTIRKNQPRLFIPHAAVSQLVLTQPYDLNELLSNPRFVGKGLLSRFLIAIPSSPVDFVRNPPAIPDGVKERYEAAVQRMLTMQKHTLQTTHEAQEIFKDWREECFYKLRGEWAVLETVKLVGHAARLACVLQTWESNNLIMEADQMRDAVALARWFAEHMLRLYGAQNTVSRQAQDVLTLLQKRGEGCVLEWTLTDTLRKRKGFDKEGFERALCELEVRGYVQRDEVKGGGRPMKYIYLHPELMQERGEIL